MSIRQNIRRKLVLAGLFGVVTPALATITGVLPDITLIPPPPAVTLGSLKSDVDIFAFNEGGCVILPGNLYTDQGTIPAGTHVQCHFFHSEPETMATTLAGRAQFDADIIGVISASWRLDDSDLKCGHPAVTYPPLGAELNRGLDGQPMEGYAVSANKRVIEIHTNTPLGTSDQVRVVTECSTAAL